MQVTVERAQASDLALQRCGREWCRARAVGQLAEERGQLGVLDREHVTPVVGEKRAELNQVAAVGIDRVAREAALALEIGKQGQHELLEGFGSSWQASAHSALFAGADANPCTPRRRSARRSRNCADARNPIRHASRRA
ncbi:MAG: hypothetical protein WBP81_23460 [Solirubrobacteraceae bacterium]